MHTNDISIFVHREIEACNHLLAALMTIFNHLLSFHSWSEDGNLFPTKKEHTPDEILQRVSGINQFAFYGRCMGFQYHDSIKPVLKFISISMAGYSESYYSKNSTLIKATNSMFTTGKYFLDPELRSRRIVNLSNNASIDFCKVACFLNFSTNSCPTLILHENSSQGYNFFTKIRRKVSFNFYYERTP